MKYLFSTIIIIAYLAVKLAGYWLEDQRMKPIRGEYTGGGVEDMPLLSEDNFWDALRKGRP